MYTTRTLIGMPVVCGSRRVGMALRAGLTGDLTRLDGLWISAGLRGTRYIPAESLEMLGHVAVMAEDTGKRGRMGASPFPMRAVSTDGRRLGAITGAEIDEVSFAVTALELSAGVWDDLARSRQRVTRYTVNRDGEVIIDISGRESEEDDYENWADEGTGCGHADRGIGGDGVRRHELADRAKVEPEGEANRQLDI